MPPASETTDSFGLPDERDLAGIASGCVRDVEEVRERTEFALLLWSKGDGDGEMGDEVVFPSRGEFPKEGLLLDTARLSSNALTSGGTGIW